ncbi:MAG: metal-sensitive transcriptional regulator [Longilinea sp.]|nr:metal-sensitive transcriptional regulator [Longilinea sp.]
MQNEDSKQALLHRLRRIEGQLRGVQAMIREERPCDETLQQLHAIRAALQGATLLLVQEYLGECLLQTSDAELQEREKIYQNLLQLLKQVT